MDKEETQIVETVVEQEVASAEPTQTLPKDEKKYTDAEVNEIIDKKFAKWKATQEKEQSEAKKLAKMSADEKIEYENQQLKNEIAELKRTQALNDMSKVARGLLAEEQITVSDALLARLIDEDAEVTKATVSDFIKMYQADLETAVNARLNKSAKVPKTQSNITETPKWQQDFLNREEDIIYGKSRFKHSNIS